MFVGIAYGEKFYKILPKSYKIPYGLFVLILFGFCRISARKGTKTTKDLTTET